MRQDGLSTAEGQPMASAVANGAGTLLRAQLSYEHGAPILTLTGEADLSTRRSLRSALAAAADSTSGPVVVDLSNLGFCDIGSLTELAVTHQRDTRPGAGLLLAGLSEMAARVWRIAFVDRPGADRLPDCYPTAAAAVAALVATTATMV